MTLAVVDGDEVDLPKPRPRPGTLVYTPALVYERLSNRAAQALKWFSESCVSCKRSLGTLQGGLSKIVESEKVRKNSPGRLKKLLGELDNKMSPLLGRFAQVRDALEALADGYGCDVNQYRGGRASSSIQMKVLAPKDGLFSAQEASQYTELLQRHLNVLSEFADDAKSRIVDISAQVREGKCQPERISALVRDFLETRNDFWSNYLSLVGGVHRRLESLEKNLGKGDPKMSLKKKQRGPNQILKELRSLAEAVGVETPDAPPAAPTEPSGVSKHMQELKGMFNEMRSFYEDDALDAMIQKADSMEKGATDEAMDEFMKECDQIASELADAGEKNKSIAGLGEKFNAVFGEMKNLYAGKSDGADDDSADDATAHAEKPEGDGDGDEDDGKKKAKKKDGEEEPAADPAAEKPMGEADGDDEEADDEGDEEDGEGSDAKAPAAAPAASSAGPKEIALGSKLPPAGAQASDIVKPTKGGPGDTQVPAVQVTIMRENRERGRAMRESSWGARPRR